MNTPTPWRIDPLAPWLIIDEPGDSVCQTQQRVSLAIDQNQTERKANAALICRAVNSHDALVAALETFERICTRRWRSLPADTPEKQAIDAARAALALAKGEA